MPTKRRIRLERSQGDPVHGPIDVDVETVTDASVDPPEERPQFPTIVWWRDGGYLVDREEKGVMCYVEQTSVDLPDA